MSLKNTMRMVEEVDDVRGYCLALAIDSVVERDLPDVYYDLAKSARGSEEENFNDLMAKILRDFYSVKPDESNDKFPLATFNAFGASAQTYFPDVPYEYPDQASVNPGLPNVHKKARLETILKRAGHLGCGILFFSDDNHIQSLQTIQDVDGPLFIPREYGLIRINRLYEPTDLSGRNAFFAEQTTLPDPYTPLPEIAASYFPDGKQSWELVILPPSPR